MASDNNIEATSIDGPSEYSVDILPPDISAYRSGNTTIDYFHSFDSGKPGPHVAITAVTHGNELCGAITLDWLLSSDVRPIAGKLSLGFVNVDAYHRFDSTAPAESRFVDEDFNRLWADEVISGDSNRDSSEIRRAREILPIISDIDYLLDIHSMQHPAPSLMMCGPRSKGRELGVALASTQWCISDWGHVAGRRMRDFAPFINESNTKNSLLVECGQHWERSSVAVSHHTAVRFLRHFDVVSEQAVHDLASIEPRNAPKVAQVSDPYTMKSADFEFTEAFKGMEIIAKAGTVIGHDSGEPVVTPYDNCVLVMPTRRREKGQSAVRFAAIIDE